MKGIILAGGYATRLYPMTSQISKQLLPVYDAPMIFYPLNVLIKAGIKDILVITSPNHSGAFMNLLDPMFRPFGIRILSAVQEIPKGLPDAFVIGKGFIGDDNVALILGDNIFEDSDVLSREIKNFEGGGQIFVKKVPDPERFGVAKFDRNNRVVEIVEKPKHKVSPYAITGLYIFGSEVGDVSGKLKPSERGEVEITDLHRHFLAENRLKVTRIKGAWLDAGTPEALVEANMVAMQKKLSKNFSPVIKEAIERGRDLFKKRVKHSLTFSS